jgi:signal transduction histidine kinase
MGQQAAAAIENARLYERARHEASTSRALLRVTRAMNASIRLEEILQLIVDSLSELIGTPAVSVSLLAPDGAHFEIAVTRALARHPIDVEHTGPEHGADDDGRLADDRATSGQRVSGLARLVLDNEGPSVVADTRDRPDLELPILRDGSAPRSIAIAPIRLGERVLGVVEAYSTEPNHFSEDDTALLSAFADQAATAIESARLFGQARELALLQERDRIAKELHDGIIQTIYAVGLTLDYCRLALRENPDDVEARLGDATGGLNRAISDIRNYILNLTHRVGGVVGLREAAEGLAGEYGRSAPPGQAPVSITIDVTDEASTAVPSERRAELVQVLREAIANAVRHAHARSLTITSRIEGGKLVLAVADDGVGFDVTAGSTEEHHGLRNMANRARMLDGHLTLDSAPGRGTTITMVAPLGS